MNSILKDLLTQYHRTIEYCEYRLASAIKFFTSAIESNLSIAGNCLLLLGYLISQMYFENYNAFLIASMLILSGQFLITLSSEAYAAIADLPQTISPNFGMSRFSVNANNLTIIEEYQVLYDASIITQ